MMINDHDDHAEIDTNGLEGSLNFFGPVEGGCLLTRVTLERATKSEDAKASAEGHLAACMACQAYFKEREAKSV